jgi:hypothetical protein
METGWHIQLNRDIRYAQIMSALGVISGVACGFVGFAFAGLGYRAAHAAMVSLARRRVTDSEIRRRVALAETLAMAGLICSTLNLVIGGLLTIYLRTR